MYADSVDELERARLYRQLDVEPTNLAVLDALIEAESAAGDTSAVVQHLWVAAFHFEQRGDGRGALAAFERLAKLDRDATRNLTSLALTCGRLNLPPNLVPYLAQAMRVVEARGIDALVDWTTRICKLPANSIELTRELSNPITSQEAADAITLQRQGAMFQKLGDNKSAATSFAGLAEQYEKDGFFLKAIALLKQVVKLDARPEFEMRLGTLHVRLQLFAEAKIYFRRAEDQFIRAGDRSSAELAPNDGPS